MAVPPPGVHTLFKISLGPSVSNTFDPWLLNLFIHCSDACGGAASGKIQTEYVVFTYLDQCYKTSCDKCRLIVVFSNVKTHA